MLTASVILAALTLFVCTALAAFVVYISKAFVDKLVELHSRLAEVEASLREHLQLSTTLSSTIVTAIEARQDFKDREGQLLSHHQSLINRLADLADPKRIPPGMRPATPEELARLKERNQEAVEKALAAAPSWPGIEKDTRPEINQGMLRHLRPGKRTKDEPQAPDTSSLPISPTPSSSGVSL